jgi:hypothetical protein
MRGSGSLLALVLAFVVSVGSEAYGNPPDLAQEIEALKQKVAELEQQLNQQKAAQQKVERRIAEKIHEEVEEHLDERFGSLEIHGGAILYYQGSQTGKLDGEHADSPSGAGFTADLELTWKPALPLLEDGQFYARIHAGDGTGADRSGSRNNNPVNVLLANLNTIADDNTGGDTGLNLLEAHYTHEFFDNTIKMTGGKAKNLMFLDGNAFANNEKQQFVGKPFVNNSVLDSESEYTPLLGADFKPIDLLTLSVVGTSTSRPLVEGTPLADTAKSKYDNVFSTPFLGSQLTVSPKFGELAGNYRLYGWWAGYNHSKLDSDRNPVAGRSEKGWGLGISADQQITENIGLFGRFAWNNDDVYVVQWEASGGLSLKGLIPSRENDTLGFGVAFLTPGNRYRQNDPEIHFEAYYRIAVTEHLAFSPDLQYVLNPGGDSHNDGIWAGMIRGEFNF